MVQCGSLPGHSLRFKTNSSYRKNTGKVFGDLTLLGTTKPLTLDVTFNGAYRKKFLTNVPALGFSATASLKRSDWGMTSLIPLVADRVDILIEAEFDKVEEK